MGTRYQARSWHVAVLTVAGLLLVAVAALAFGLPRKALAYDEEWVQCPTAGSFTQAVEDQTGTALLFYSGDSPCTIQLTGTVTLQANADITIRGYNKLTISGGTADQPGDFNLFELNDNAKLTVDGVTLQYASSGTDNADTGLHAMSVTVKNSVVQGFTTFGIRANASNGTGDVTVINSVFQDNRDGIALPTGGSITVTNSQIKDSTQHGINGQISDDLNPLPPTRTFLIQQGSVISGNLSNGIFAADANVTVTDSTLTNNGHNSDGKDTINADGTVTLTNSTVSDGGRHGVAATGQITATNSQILDNDNDGLKSATGISAASSTISGNGFIGLASFGKITATNCTIANNDSSGIDSETSGDDIKVVDSVIIGNGPGEGVGGPADGVYTSSGNITVSGSLISGSGQSGIHSDGVGKSVTVTNSTISGNGSGKVYSYLFGGSGVTAPAGSVTVMDSTITGNLGKGANEAALSPGYGVQAGVSATVVFSTISANGGDGIHTDGDLVLFASILAGNGGVTDHNCQLSGTLTENGYNLSTDATCVDGGTGSRPNVDLSELKLLSLGNYGGPPIGDAGSTQVLPTIALGPESLAIDQIPEALCSSVHYPNGDPITTDERGITHPRPAGGNCDVGAYEAPAVKLTLSPSAGPDPDTGWYNAETLGGQGSTLGVSAGFTGLANGQAASCTGADFSGLPATATTLNQTAEGSAILGDGTYTVSCGVAQDETQLGVSVTGAEQPLVIKIDTTDPRITLDVPIDGAPYELNQQVDASFSCADATSDITPGNCVGTVPNGDPIDTSGLGSHAFTVNATDNAGNSASQTVHYTVAYLVDELPGTTTTVRQGYYAVIRIAPEDANGHDYAKRGLKVTSVELDGPNGDVIPFVYSFQFGRFSGTNGYQLSINTRNLTPGDWTLKLRIGNDTTIYNVAFTVE